jgi:hypothetical protein
MNAVQSALRLAGLRAAWLHVLRLFDQRTDVAMGLDRKLDPGGRDPLMAVAAFVFHLFTGAPCLRAGR